MAKYYSAKSQTPIIYYLRINNLTKIALCRLLHCTHNRLDHYIEDYTIIPLKHIILMAGLFNISPEQLVYLLIRTKETLQEKDKGYFFKHGLKV